METTKCSYQYSQNSTRNPSPPPFTEHEKETISADYIGDTLFSKKWVLSILLKLFKHDGDNIYVNKNVENLNNVNEIEKDLQSKFENEVCELWDSSVNSDVAWFIFKNQGKDIFMEVIENTSTPRLTEICFGLLGNLICVDDINICYGEDKSFRTTMLDYLSISDALSLVELTRMLNVCMSNKKTLSLWIDSISKCSAMENLLNILQNSLNIQLLQHVIQLIVIIFDTDALLIDKYANSSLFLAVLESYNVIRSKNQELVPELLHILQLVSTTEKGVEELCMENSIFSLLTQCILDEQNIFVDIKHALLISVFSILGCLLFAKPIEFITLINESINVFQHLITVFNERVAEVINSNGDASCNLDEELYVPVYLEVFHDVCQTISKYKVSYFANIIKCLNCKKLEIKDVFERLDRENIPLEWERFVKNLQVLNEKHCILNFSVDAKY